MNRDTVVPKVKKIPGKKARAFLKKHMKHAANATYLKSVIRDGDAWSCGPFFTDVDGNVLLDFVSHVGAMPLGYNHPSINMMKRKTMKYDPDRYAGTDFILKADVPTSTDLHAKIASITKHLGMDTQFFSNSGAEAVENAIKICYDYRRNNGLGVAFKGAFHGRTLGALSLNASKKVQRKWYPKIPVQHLSYCDCPSRGPISPNISRYACKCGWEIKRGDVEINGLEELLKITEPDEIAYVIIEPLQGEGGYKVPNKDFIQSVYKICSLNSIPVISDEIQAGLGRTGKWWGVEHFDVVPDVLTSAKALGVGATISRREMFPSENGRISSTWGEGNLMASAIGYTTIEVIEKEDLLENADNMGMYLRGGLRELVDQYNPWLSNVRGLGLMDAVDAFYPGIRDKIIDGCLEKGLVLIGCGYSSIRFLPPLNVNEREIDLAVGIMDDVVRKLRG